MNNILTAEEVKNLGLSKKYINAKYRFQYQKTGGFIVCPMCGSILGIPKHNANGVIMHRYNRHGVEVLPRCKHCYKDVGTITGTDIIMYIHPMGIIKYTNNATNVHCKTTITLTTVDGEKFSATVKLNKNDVYDKKVAKMCAFDKLINKLEYVLF